MRLDLRAAWRIDNHNPYEDAFEEALLSEVEAANMTGVLALLRRIQHEPFSGVPRDIDGDQVYVVKGLFRLTSGRSVEYRIAYVIDTDKNVIRPLLVTRSDNDLTDEVLRDVIASPSPSNKAENQVALFPDEPTHLPAAAIEEAVKRVTNRTK